MPPKRFASEPKCKIEVLKSLGRTVYILVVFQEEIEDILSVQGRIYNVQSKGCLCILKPDFR